jgi:hypothetical protein
LHDAYGRQTVDGVAELGVQAADVVEPLIGRRP